MQEMTKRAVQKLLKDTSHALDVADFDDVVELDKLAEKIIRQTTEERRLLNQPFELCGIKFYPLTIAKSLWYAEKVSEWEVPIELQDAFLFWLLTIPNTEDALSQYDTSKDANKAARLMSRKLCCSQDDMMIVLQKCIGKTVKSESNKEQSDTNYGALIAIMLREYGGTPDQWLYETPVEKVGALVDQYVSRINAEHEANANSSSKKGKAVAPVATAKLEALKNFREKVNAIKAKWVANG